MARTREQAIEINRRLAAEDTAPHKGSVVVVFGADPSNKYGLRYEVRELDDLVTSNTESGAINPNYPGELQPRDRTRMASRRQVENMARNLESEAMVSDSPVSTSVWIYSPLISRLR